MKPAVGFQRPLARSAARNCGGLFLGGAADLADHDDRLGFRVGEEHFQHVDMFGALDRVAADADGGGLAEAEVGGLLDGLIGEGAGAGDDADLAAAEDVAGHDADLAGVGRDHAGAVRADEAGPRAFERALDLHHVKHGDAFGDADDERDVGVDGLEDASAAKGGGT
jgi:hypothetical protein